MKNINKKYTIFSALLHKTACFASLSIFLTSSVFALESLTDEELKGVTGQDGVDIKLILDNSVAGGPVDGATADGLRWVEDGNTITLSSFAMGAVDERDNTIVNSNNGVKTVLDLYSTDAPANPGVGVSASVEWDRLALRNRITFNEADTSATADDDIQGTLFDWQWSGEGKLLVKNTFFSDLLESNVTSSLGSEGGANGTGGTEAYLQIKDNNFHIGNPYEDTALLARDFDVTFCFHDGAINVDASVCGNAFNPTFAADVGYTSEIGIDGTYGIFAATNRFELDMNFVWAHRTFNDEADYNVFDIDSDTIGDFFGVQLNGALQNFIFALSGGGSDDGDGVDGSSGFKFLVQAEEEQSQFSYALPSIQIYDPAPITATQAYETNTSDRRSLRLDDFREFHNKDNPNVGVDDGLPGLYIPFTLDIVGQNANLGSTNINLGTDANSYNYTLDPLISPSTAALLTIEDNLFGTTSDINGGGGGGIIDLYADDVNIGTIGSAGDSMGGFVASIRNLESKFLFTSSRLIRQDANGDGNANDPCGATISASGNCSVNPSALISFGGFGKIAESGFGWVDTDENTGDKWFLGFRNFGGFIQADPLKNYLYPAKNHRGITGNDGFLFNLNAHIATTDFSFGISKAYNTGDYRDALFDIGDVVNSESIFKARLRLFTAAQVLLKPTDDGIMGIDATIDFLAKDNVDVEKQNLIYFVDDDPLADVEFGLSDFRGAFATRANINGLSSGVGEPSSSIEGEEVAKIKFDTESGVETLRLEMPLQVISGQESLPTLSVGFDVQQYGQQALDNQQQLVRTHIPVGAIGVINAEVWGR